MNRQACLTSTKSWFIRWLCLLALAICNSHALANQPNEFLSNDWKAASVKVRSLINQQSPVDKVIRFSDNTKMMVQKLPFYHGISIAAVFGGWKPVELTLFYLIIDEDRIERITGNGELFARIGKVSRFRYDPTYLGNYLWFRMFFTRNAEHNPFLVLESPEAFYFPDLESIDRSQANKIKNAVRPISCREVSETVSRCSATILFESNLYSADINIDDKGIVEMVDDEVVVTNVSFDPRIPLGVWALTTTFSPDESEVTKKSSTSTKKGWSF